MKAIALKIRATADDRRLIRGFTIVELMVTLAVLSILLAIAIPAFNDAILGNRLTSYANDLVGGSLQARSEAVKRNTTATLCVSSNGASCGTGGWEQGWIVLSGAT